MFISCLDTDWLISAKVRILDINKDICPPQNCLSYASKRVYSKDEWRQFFPVRARCCCSHGHPQFASMLAINPVNICTSVMARCIHNVNLLILPSDNFICRFWTVSPCSTVEVVEYFDLFCIKLQISLYTFIYSQLPASAFTSHGKTNQYKQT